MLGPQRVLEDGKATSVTRLGLVKAALVPFTIVRATQFFEFIKRIADSTPGDTVHLPPALFQPGAAAELGARVAEIAEGAPVNGVVEVAGPEPLPMSEAVAKVLAAAGDPRTVVADPHAEYFGTELNNESLVPDEGPRLTATSFDDWLEKQPA